MSAMLYISRRVDTTHYGVVDTDDCTETVVSVAELENLTCSYYRSRGIEPLLQIRGVVLSREHKQIGIEMIVPYKGPGVVPADRIRMVL